MGTERRIMQVEKQLLNLGIELEEMRYRLRNTVGSIFMIIGGLVLVMVLFKF